MTARVLRIRGVPPEALVPFYRDNFGFNPIADAATALDYAEATGWRGLPRVPFVPGAEVVLQRGDQFLEVLSDAPAGRVAIDPSLGLVAVEEETGSARQARIIVDPMGNEIGIVGAAASTSRLTSDRPPRESTSVFADVAGCSIHACHWLASGEQPTHLRLIHGSRAHLHWWDRMMQLAGFDVAGSALDQSGHGASGWRASYSLDLWIDEVVQSLLVGVSEPVTLTAHSHGGRLALAVAAREPSLVRQVVLIDTAVNSVVYGVAALQKPPRVHRDLGELITRFRLLPSQPWPIGSALDRLAVHSVREVPDGWSWRADPKTLATLTDEHLIDSLAGINCPIHLIRGQFSPVTTASDAQFIRGASGQPTSDLVIEGGFHHLPLDSPVQLLAALLQIEEQGIADGARWLA